MEQNVYPFIEKHELLHIGAKVLVGVSGGPDSMALLHLLHQMKDKWQLEIEVLSVDHQLRGEDSAADFNYVREVCLELGLPFHGTKLDVAKFSEEMRLSIEVAARELRYQFFQEKMEETGGDYLALGHHGDDQIETLVMKLVRTASSTAFQGIPVKRPFAGGMIIRPLLSVTKEEIETYCERYGIIPRIDATNLETEHTRNYYRHMVIPLLKEKNNNIHQTAQYLSETLEEDEQYLQKQAEKVLKNTTTFDHGKKQVLLNLHTFNTYDRPLQRRTFHLILNYLYEKLPSQLSYVHEEQFFRLIQEQSGSVQVDFPNSLKLERVYDKLYFHFDDSHHQQFETFSKALSVPGTTILPNGAKVTVTYAKKQDVETRYSFYVPLVDFTLPLYVRTRRDGDRMSWKGLQGTKKIKDIFIDAKIPLQKRKVWPLIVDNEGKILWLIGLKKGKTTNSDNGQFLYIQYEKGEH